eukprot:1252059-Amphidinium_carterae.1
MEVCSKGCALEFASAEIRGDREVVIAAVTDDGSVLLHAAPELYRRSHWDGKLYPHDLPADISD